MSDPRAAGASGPAPGGRPLLDARRTGTTADVVQVWVGRQRAAVAALRTAEAERDAAVATAARLKALMADVLDLLTDGQLEKLRRLEQERNPVVSVSLAPSTGCGEGCGCSSG